MKAARGRTQHYISVYTELVKLDAKIAAKPASAAITADDMKQDELRALVEKLEFVPRIEHMGSIEVKLAPMPIDVIVALRRAALQRLRQRNGETCLLVTV